LHRRDVPAGRLRGGGRMTAYPSLMPKYRRTAALACIASQMTMTGPGISRSPASQRRTVRPLSTRTRRAKASAERPSLCRIDLRSAGVISRADKNGAEYRCRVPRPSAPARQACADQRATNRLSRPGARTREIRLASPPSTNYAWLALRGEGRNETLPSISPVFDNGAKLSMSLPLQARDGGRGILRCRALRRCGGRYSHVLGDLAECVALVAPTAEPQNVGDLFFGRLIGCHLSSPCAGGHHCPIDQSTIGPMVLISKSRNVTITAAVRSPDPAPCAGSAPAREAHRV